MVAALVCRKKIGGQDSDHLKFYPFINFAITITGATIIANLNKNPITFNVFISSSIIFPFFYSMKKFIIPPLFCAFFVQSDRILSDSFATVQSKRAASSWSILLVSGVILTAICSVLFSFIPISSLSLVPLLPFSLDISTKPLVSLVSRIVGRYLYAP